MEATRPVIRYRANFSVTTKGVYTPDVTIEIANCNESEGLSLNHEVIREQLSQLFDDVKTVAESKGFVSSVIEQK